jgi:hypothetical protein
VCCLDAGVVHQRLDAHTLKQLAQHASVVVSSVRAAVAAVAPVAGTSACRCTTLPAAAATRAAAAPVAAMGASSGSMLGIVAGCRLCNCQASSGACSRGLRRAGTAAVHSL